MFSLLKSILEAGVKMVQLRDKVSCRREVIKEAAAMRKITSLYKALFIVNDFIDVALISQADGVHIGKEDPPLAVVKPLLKEDMLIGVTCRNLREALIAQENGASYVGVGPAFYTTTKRKLPPPLGVNRISRIQQKINIPLFAIGGIDQEDKVRLLKDAAIRRIAVCSVIADSSSIKKTVGDFSQILGY